MTTPTVPHSRESEEAVAGAVLIDPEAYDVCAQFITSEDFYIHRLRWLWEAFGRMKAEGTPIDFLTVCGALEAVGRLDEFGGPAYLTTLLTQTPTSLHAEAYARAVKKMSIRRGMLAAANQMATLAYNENAETDKSLSEMQAELARLCAINTGREVAGLTPALDELYKEIQERSKSPCDVWGLRTGFPKLDAETGGQHAGEMTILAAEPGLGKTWLALGFAYEMSKSAPGAFFSLEMKTHALARRLVSGVGEIRSRNMRTGRMDPKDWEKLNGTIEHLEKLPFYLDDRARDTSGLRSSLARLKRDFDIRWFVLDYMQLLTDEGKDDNERTKKIGRELKNMCSDLDLAGIVINSVNKAGMDKSGRDAHAKSHMSGSGQNIHDADVTPLLIEFEPENTLTYYSPEQRARMATLWCKKGRELEDARFRINLVRREHSPFWGEMDRE